MSYRVRILTPGQRAKKLEITNYTNGHPNFVDVGMSYAGEVREVDSMEVVLEGPVVDERLRNGSLKSTDLVWLDDRWLPLREAIPFMDAAESAARREGRRLFARSTLIFVAVVVAFGVYAFFRYAIRNS